MARQAHPKPAQLQGIATFRILVVVLLVIGVSALIFWLIPKRAGQPSSQSVNTQQTTSQTPLTFDTRQATPIPDADTDGLSDQDEAGLGTNPTLADTDRDELTDFDEVKIYRTDPRKPDSDEDGHTDGSEVRNRFNPSGPGKLFETVPPKDTN